MKSIITFPPSPQLTMAPEIKRPRAATTGQKPNDDAGTVTFVSPSRKPELPQFLRDMLACPPAAGTGVHSWLFRVARQLHAHRSEEDIVSLLAATVEGCGRHVSRSEIVAAVRNSRACAWRPNGSGVVTAPARQEWPAVNRERREAIVAEGFSLPDLWEASPVRLDEDGPDTEAIIDALFPGDPLLCVGRTNRDAITVPRESLRGRLSEHQFIVPSAMSARVGQTRDGRPSARTLTNVGRRAYLVCEFDEGTTDEHAALLWHLAKYAGLRLAVHSGGKSLHGWFDVRRWPEEKSLRFMRYAVSLSADRATWTRNQFVRMPGGRRDNGNEQIVWYYNPGGAE